MTYILVLIERFRSCTRNSPFTLSLGGLYSGGLIFGGKFVLVNRGASIRGASIRDFTVCPITSSRFALGGTPPQIKMFHIIVLMVRNQKSDILKALDFLRIKLILNKL